MINKEKSKRTPIIMNKEKSKRTPQEQEAKKKQELNQRLERILSETPELFSLHFSTKPHLVRVDMTIYRRISRSKRKQIVKKIRGLFPVQVNCQFIFWKPLDIFDQIMVRDSVNVSEDVVGEKKNEKIQ